MGASYIERLIWRFFKDKVFGGFRVLVHRYVFPVLIFAVFILLYEYFVAPNVVAIFFVSLLLMITGLLFAKRVINPYHVAIILALSLSIWFFPMYFDLHFPLIEDYIDTIAMPILFVWFLFNSTVFVVQMFDFFASTGGLYLLLGSDEDRVFLSPIPQIIFIATIVYVLYRFPTVSIYYLMVAMIAPLISLILIYTVARSKGRIVRAALSIYTIMAVYSAFVFLTRIGTGVNVVMWALLCMLSTLFTIQQHARKAVKEGERGVVPTFFVYLLIGFILMVAHILSPMSVATSNILVIWWILSMIAIIVAPIAAYLIAIYNGKMEYYVKRNKFTAMTLLKETMQVLGKKAIEELKKISIKNLFSMILGR